MESEAYPIEYDLPTAEASNESFQKDAVLLADILGFEEVAVDIDFSKNPVDILRDLGVVLADNIELTPEMAQKEVFRTITSFAIDTFYERVVLKDSTNGSYAEILDSATNDLENFIAEKYKLIDADIALTNLTRDQYIEMFPTVNREIMSRRYEVLNDVLSKVDLSFSKDKNVESSFLRVSPLEGVDPNCLYFGAIVLSTTRKLGIPAEDTRMFLAGYHGGVLIKGYPYENKVSIADSYSSNIKIENCYAENPLDLFTEDRWKKYKNFTEFADDSDHLSFGTVPASNIGRSTFSVLSAEDGILAAEFLLLGHFAQIEGHNDVAKHHYENALKFDPDNSFVKSRMTVIETP